MENSTLVSVGTTVMASIQNATKSGGDSEVDTSAYSEVEKYFWIIFSPLFLVIGILGNSLNIYVLVKLRFYKNSTYTLLFVLAFTDLTVLITGLTRYWIDYMTDFDLRKVSGFSCKLSLFLIYFSMQLSSWILVLVTVIRFFKTFVPLRRKALKDITIKKTLISLLGIAVVLALVNLHFFWTNGIDAEGDCGSLTPEYFEFDEKVFVYIDLLLLSIFPSIIMIILNSLISYELSKLSRTRRRMSNQFNGNSKQNSTKRVTWMLLVTTSYFIVATIPICIYFIVDSYVRPSIKDDALSVSYLDLAWTFCYLFQFSHFALNFYLYTATNERFRKELMKLTHNVYKRISTSSTQAITKAPREYSSDSRKISATNST